MKVSQFVLALGVAMVGAQAWAKIPPPPPLDPVAAAAKAEKDKAAAEKTKAQQNASEDKAVKNFQANMKKAGKPVPRATPIVAAAAPPAVAPAKAASTAAPISTIPAKK